MEPAGPRSADRPWEATTKRLENDAFGSNLYLDSDREIVQAVLEVAETRGVPAAQIALAWVNSHPVVTAPIVGMSKPEHLQDAIGSLEIELSAEELAKLEAPYTPRLAPELSR